MAIAIAVAHTDTSDTFNVLGLKSECGCSTSNLSQWKQQQTDSTYMTCWIGLEGKQCFHKNEVLLQFKSYKYINGTEEMSPPPTASSWESCIIWWSKLRASIISSTKYNWLTSAKQRKGDSSQVASRLRLTQAQHKSSCFNKKIQKICKYHSVYSCHARTRCPAMLWCGVTP